ncbi:MAG: hypothetical protein ACR2PR_04880 [Pseudohongiellaceae bacterium]
MAKHSEVSLSGQNLGLDEINQYYREIEASVRLYFSPSNPRAKKLFVGMTNDDVDARLQAASKENDLAATLNIFAAIEAAFCVDYLLRCRDTTKKDSLSLALQRIYNNKRQHAPPLRDIFKVWGENGTELDTLFSELNKAFKYRHWLAHGRYWKPDFDNYDYDSVYILAQAAFEECSL